MRNLRLSRHVSSINSRRRIAEAAGKCGMIGCMIKSNILCRERQANESGVILRLEFFSLSDSRLVSRGRKWLLTRARIQIQRSTPPLPGFESSRFEKRLKFRSCTKMDSASGNHPRPPFRRLLLVNDAGFTLMSSAQFIFKTFASP